jgi:hypothetical protein
MWDRLILWLLSSVVNQLNRMEDLIMSVQDDVNSRATQLSAAIAAERQQVSDAVTTLLAEIQSLKDQIASGQTVDFTALDAAIAEVNDVFTPTP